MNLWHSVVACLNDDPNLREITPALKQARIAHRAGARFIIAGPPETIEYLYKLNGRTERAIQAVTGLDSVEIELQVNGDDWLIDRLTVTSALEALTADIPPPVYAVEGILPVGLSLLAGAPKTGKSLLALQLCHAVATGSPIFGRAVEAGRFWYISLEDELSLIQDRMQAQGWAKDDSRLSLSSFYWYDEFRSEVRQLDDEGGARIAEQIARRKYRLVVIDTMKLAIPGGGHRLISDYDFMAETLRPIKAIAHQQETCILLLHHFGKLRSAEPDVVQDALGSIAIGGTVDTLFGLYQREGTGWAELGIVGRRIERQKMAIQMDAGNLRWGLFDGPTIELTDRRQEILEALESFRQADTETPGKRVKGRGGPGRANVGEIAAAIEQNRGNTHTRLRELEAAGVVVRRVMGRNVYYELGHKVDD